MQHKNQAAPSHQDSLIRSTHHSWSALFQGSAVFNASLQKIHEMQCIVLPDLLSIGQLSNQECKALTNWEPQTEKREPLAAGVFHSEERLKQIINRCSIAPMNPMEGNFHTYAEVWEEDSGKWVVFEPLAHMFPHATIIHVNYNAKKLKKLFPDVYSRVEPPEELCLKMQEAVDEMKMYLDASHGHEFGGTGRRPYKLYIGIFPQMQALCISGNNCVEWTRYAVAYLRAWGLSVRVCVGSLAVRLPSQGRKGPSTLMYGCGRGVPMNMRDLWDNLVRRHAVLFPERAADVQRIYSAGLVLDDIVHKMLPPHIVQWAWPMSHPMLPLVLPKRCSACGKGGQLLLCRRCRVVNYCSRECQVRHFVQHKTTCRSMLRLVQTLSQHDAELIVQVKAQPAATRSCRTLL